jgi:hypothetical protein
VPTAKPGKDYEGGQPNKTSRAKYLPRFFKKGRYFFTDFINYAAIFLNEQSKLMKKTKCVRVATAVGCALLWNKIYNEF